MKHELRFGAHVGTASLLLIFLTLALVSFAALSLAGAQAGERLTRKLSDYANAYYKACSDGERFVAATDMALIDAKKQSKNERDYEKRTAEIPNSFTTAVTDNQRLIVELEFLSLKEAGENPLYRIKSWRTEAVEEGDYTRHLPVSGEGIAND